MIIDSLATKLLSLSAHEIEQAQNIQRSNAELTQRHRYSVAQEGYKRNRSAVGCADTSAHHIG